MSSSSNTYIHLGKGQSIYFEGIHFPTAIENLKRHTIFMAYFNLCLNEDYIKGALLYEEMLPYYTQNKKMTVFKVNVQVLTSHSIKTVVNIRNEMKATLRLF